MNNAAGCLIQTEIKCHSNSDFKTIKRQFIFEDYDIKNSFEFKNIKLDLFPNGKWTFYIAAQGLNATTLLKNGRTSGPELFIQFKDKDGLEIESTSLGQVNYSCHADSLIDYVCKGMLQNADDVENVEIRYEAFIDFACRKN